MEIPNLCDCSKFGVKNVDTELYGYDWHQHEFRFSCPCPYEKHNYVYCQMRKPWHDMTEEEQKKEIEWAYEEVGRMCPKCEGKRYLI